ncbi:uncharacterized protein NDAI_0A05430 [Naumovozyma dairenensis CBS 421]|uniref:Zinc-ribbon 15 domain-containing protein n=1 Tax=Naumovozyma dairenensis (strain ATCC 10597 / BCRC 20456 / CBS 421 / NBRC 0211 / NRRL Y-12639) TaxID=1071378 RepID=G0W4G0_NAUDC|nr:hypothetical protein NDAI_0A05430 [Naumovozyma dairenensis CBS 421]CCD22698.1 hypothetical protein NDAI_0A05430 [Naumovozyma dairenensis CBS 421]
MFFLIPFVCGINHYDKEYDNNPNHKSIYCPNCHNFSVRPIKRREFVSLWWVPIVPLYWGKQLHCPICNWRQDFKNDEQLQKILVEQNNIKTGAPPKYS